MRAIVLDIEGTTTPIAFVRDTLFPYARRELRDYLTRLADAEIGPLAAEFHREYEQEAAAADRPAWRGGAADVERESVARYATWLMDRDRKSTALKALQGRIWEQGYRSGELIAPVYDDVPVALRRWREQGIRTGIYSSGSVLAQQLLFQHSSAGDLTPLLSWYFDTTVGAKIEADSYRRIASAIAVPAAAVLFISDVVRELDAAREAGLQTLLCHRPGEAEPDERHDHGLIWSFDAVPSSR